MIYLKKSMVKKIFWILLIVIVLSFGIKTDFSLAQQSPVKIDFFYSAICPHCAEEKEFLEELGKKYPEIEIKKYEVISSPENQKILKDFYEKYKVPAGEQGWVPVTFTPTNTSLALTSKSPLILKIV